MFAASNVPLSQPWFPLTRAKNNNNCYAMREGSPRTSSTAIARKASSPAATYIQQCSVIRFKPWGPQGQTFLLHNDDDSTSIHIYLRHLSRSTVPKIDRTLHQTEWIVHPTPLRHRVSAQISSQPLICPTRLLLVIHKEEPGGLSNKRLPIHHVCQTLSKWSGHRPP